MRIEAVRDSIVAWGIQNGLFDQRSMQAIPSGADQKLNPFGEEQLDLIRPRKITKIEVRNGRRLIIHFRIMPARYRRSRLIERFDEVYGKQKYVLEFSLHQPFRVDQNLARVANPVRYVNGEVIACGSSIGLGNQRNAGTLTALGKKENDLVGISCNHVTGACSTSQAGIPVVVPGIQDVTTEVNEITVVGYHDVAGPMVQGLPSEFLRVERNTDISIFQVAVRAKGKLSSQQGSGENAFDTPTAFAKAKTGINVKKWGRTTGFTKGVVTDVIQDPEFLEYNVTSYYGPTSAQVFKGMVYFEGIIEIETRGNAAFSEPGDSGALVVTDTGATDRVIGVLIGGGKRKSYVLPLQRALKTLGVTLVSGINVGV